VTSVVDLHAGPAAGFDQPFEMLDACHQRVERMLALIERLVAHLSVHGVDEQAQQAARDVMRYFDLAAPHHHEDEERHVLPLLRERGHAALANRIAQEHQAMAAAWARMRVLLAVIERGRRPGDLENMAAEGRAFTVLYREHIALEENQAFPLARAGVAAEALRAMGKEMARRRGAR
jgi:hemerythrin-like domain-containing protein